MGASQGGADVSNPLVQQLVEIPEGCSTTTPLNAGLTWTSSSHSTLGISGIQVNIKSDTNCAVYIDQSMNGTNWDITDTFNYYTTYGGNSWTVQATAAYLRVRVTNSTTTNQTVLRVQTAICPIVEALPRSLSLLGNLKTAVNEFLPTFSQSIQSTPMQALKSQSWVRLCGAAFSGTILDTNFWSIGTPTGTGAANLTSVPGSLTLTTGATANSTITVTSTRIARYVSGASNFYRSVVRVPAVVGTNTRRWGCYDANNGFFFETDGTTLSLVCRTGASDANKISSGSFNGLYYGSAYTLDTNAHTYEIHFTNSKAWFLIDGLILHTFTGTVAPLSQTLHLPVAQSNLNSGGNTNDNFLYVRTASISRFGQLETAPHWRYQAGALAATVLKYGPGHLERVSCNKSSGTSITLYDSVNTGAPANPICIIDPSARGVMDYSLDFYTGLILVTVGSVDCTIVYE